MFGIIHNMESPYEFTTEAGINTGRFAVIYAESLGTDTPVFNNNSIIVYKQSGVITINSSTADMSSVHVYDIRGRLLYSADAINAKETTIKGFSAQEQMLIIKVKTVEGAEAIKKIIY